MPRHNDGPPPPPDKPGMTLAEAFKRTTASVSSRSKANENLKDKTAIDLPIVDNTVVTLTKVDKTRAPTPSSSSKNKKDKTIINLTKADDEPSTSSSSRPRPPIGVTRVKNESSRTSSRLRPVAITKVDGPSSPSSSRQKPPQPPRPRPRSPSLFTVPSTSLAPPHAKSVYTSSSDLKMASRQMKYNTLPPAEKAQQEEWAQATINTYGPCPGLAGWVREDQHRHYRCQGGPHVITDEALAEGKGAISLYPPTVMNDPKNSEGLWGPYYKSNSSGDGEGKTMEYSGTKPKPRYAPDAFRGNMWIFENWDEEREARMVRERNMRDLDRYGTVEEKRRLCPMLSVGVGGSGRIPPPLRGERGLVARETGFDRRREDGDGRYDPYDQRPGTGSGDRRYESYDYGSQSGRHESRDGRNDHHQSHGHRNRHGSGKKDPYR